MSEQISHVPEHSDDQTFAEEFRAMILALYLHTKKVVRETCTGLSGSEERIQALGAVSPAARPHIGRRQSPIPNGFSPQNFVPSQPSGRRAYRHPKNIQ